MKVPAPLIQQLRDKFLLDADAFEAAHGQEPPTSIRLNPLKASCAFLTGNEQAVPWCAQSYYLNVRPVFTADPLFHAGCYYVQEASSMFLAEAVKQTVDLSKAMIALDACAAPGGKSTLLSSLLSSESLLVSNEVISTRVPALVHNMAKWGTTNSLVTNNDPKDFSRLPAFFDLLVVDAPCSGSGLFRKQADAVDHWSEENVKHCSLRQQRILHDLLPSLKPGGVLIYSTCSYSIEEDENICDELINVHALETLRLKPAPDPGVLETKSGSGAYGYRFFPHLAKGEGFFIACFRKPADNEQGERKRMKPLSSVSQEHEKFLKNFIGGAFAFWSMENEVVASPVSLALHVAAVSAALKVKKYPLQLGQFKGSDFIPHPHSAYLSALSATLERVELSKEDTLKFLRKQDLRLPDAPKGFVLLTYQGFGLGWAKNLGNRINSYYPAEWRILKESF